MTRAPARFETFAAEWRPRVEAELERLLPPAHVPPEPLHRAMRHAMFPAGKRLRPLLALVGAVATGGDPRRALLPAAGIECLHTYSLVHDDLPCMDDDDLRRGRPTCHKVYGEALAVLAGDALLTLAFEACAPGGAEAVAALARAAGSLGMVGGQAEDVLAEGGGAAVARTLPHVQWIHDRKTGALIAASLEVGALAGGGARADLPSLVAFGRHLGRAFQIADDCLDVTASPEALGKNTGQDAAAGKLTFPALLGLEQSLAAARAEAAAAAALAHEAARGAGAGTALDYAVGLLQDVARLSIERRS